MTPALRLLVLSWLLDVEIAANTGDLGYEGLEAWAVVEAERATCSTS
jgi:hypothetical protein